MIINSHVGVRNPLPGKVAVVTGAAPLPPEVLYKMEKLGFSVTHDLAFFTYIRKSYIHVVVGHACTFCMQNPR